MKSEIRKFVDYMQNEKRLSSNTISSYTKNLTQFFDYVDKPVSEVSHEDILKFLAKLNKENCKVSTSNQKLSTLKSFFKYMLREKICNTNPAELIECAKMERKLPEVLDESDIEHFINSIDNLRDRVIVELLYGTGIRREELTKIRVEDVNFNKGLIKVCGKGSKERIVPIHDKALKLLTEYINSHNSIWVFPSTKNKGNHISLRRVNEIIEKWSKVTGIKATPHMFRHSFATTLFERGADIKVIQDLLGHESINTTNIYANVSIERNKREYMKYHPRAM